MDFLLELAWKNAAVAGVLALVAAAAGRLLRRPAVAHGLWLLVLLKLVTPPLWHVPVPWLTNATVEPGAGLGPVDRQSELAQHYAAAIAAAAAIDSIDTNLTDTPNNRTSSETLPGQNPRAQLSLLEPSSAPAIGWSPPVDSRPKFGITWQHAIIGVWAAGSATWLGLLLLRIRRFRRFAALAVPAGEAERRRVAELAASIGLRRPPELRFLTARVPPMTWGFGRGHELLVPLDLWNSLTPLQRDALVLHELAHLRRGDHLVRHFELLVFVLHWWHPVSWWARHELQEAEEECCDAWVVRALPNSAGDYADLIVETVAYLSQRPSPTLPPLASGLGQIQHVRKRLAAILVGPAAPRLSRSSWLGLVIIGCGLLPLIPTSAKEPAGNPNNLASSFDSSERRGHKEVGFSGLPGISVGEQGFRAEGALEPTEENLAILRLQLVQKEAELAEEQLLLDLASKRAQRQSAAASKGTESLEAIEQSSTDQRVHEARFRGREAGVEELKLLVKQEEYRLKKSREKAGRLASEALVKLDPNATPGPEGATKASSPESPAVQGRLDQIEKRLDDLFAEALALKTELERERAREK